MVLNGKTRGFLMILVDFCRFSVFFEHFWSILIPGGFVRPRKNSRHTNSARRIETGRLEALEIPQIPRKIDFELVFWAGPAPARTEPGPGQARAGPGARPRPLAAAVSSPGWKVCLIDFGPRWFCETAKNSRHTNSARLKRVG